VDRILEFGGNKVGNDRLLDDDFSEFHRVLPAEYFTAVLCCRIQPPCL
jgi:hypothetical protein